MAVLPWKAVRMSHQSQIDAAFIDNLLHDGDDFINLIAAVRGDDGAVMLRELGLSVEVRVLLH